MIRRFAMGVISQCLKSTEESVISIRKLSATAASLREAGGGKSEGRSTSGNSAAQKRRHRGGQEESISRPEREEMIFDFTPFPPDDAAAKLSDETKELIWSNHSSDPVVWSVESLASVFKVSRHRIHAILWLKDLERQAEEKNGGKLNSEIEDYFEKLHGSYQHGAGDKLWSLQQVSDPSLTEEESHKKYEELSAREEEMKLKEFVQQMKFNKRVLAGEILTKRADRKRPPEGWSYVVEELGDEGKRGKGGGRRFVARTDGSRRPLNDLEKEFLARETRRPRKVWGRE